MYSSQYVDAFQGLRARMAGASTRDVAKAFTQATGLNNYDLSLLAKRIYPVPTPLRKLISRVDRNNGDVATHWKSITSINPTGVVGVMDEGKRGGIISNQVNDYLATYATLGFDNNASFQADWSSKNFDSAQGQTVLALLHSLMIYEEKTTLRGNKSLALGVTPTPSLAASVSGGTIADNTPVYVGVVALTGEGYDLNTLTTGLLQAYTRTNGDSSTTTINCGSARPSASAPTVTTGTTGSNANSIAASLTPVQGAAAYAWFWGASPANATLGAITTVANITITTAVGSSTGTPGVILFASLANTDNSQNALAFDGLNSLALGAGLATGAQSSGALVVAQNGSFTGNGAAGANEVDSDLLYFWNNWRMGPSHAFVAAQDLKDLNRIVIGGGGAPLFRFNTDRAGAAGEEVPNGVLSANAVIGSYLNPFTQTLMKLQVHPNQTPGTMTYFTDNLAPYYQYTNQAVPCEMRVRQDYWQIEWARVKPAYEFGILTSEVLCHYATFTLGVRYNITPLGN